jgi:hypothetical protein
MGTINCRRAAVMAVFLIAGLTRPAIPQENQQKKEERQVMQQKTIQYQFDGKDGQQLFYAFSDASGQGATGRYIFSELSMDKTATGKPYSADATTEFNQVLGDGNRIYRKTTARLYRDSQGRTRREQPIAAETSAGQMVIISDPVAGLNYALSPSMQTAQKASRSVVKFVTSKNMISDDTASVKIARDVVGPPISANTTEGLAGSSIVNFEPRLEGTSQEKKESLGIQVIEGVPAEGTRTTVTIPAGAIGNQLPIEIVSERWYSPDLELILMSRQSDPRVGETVYRVTNLTRGEPSPSLFEVPANYKIMGSAPGKRD